MMARKSLIVAASLALIGLSAPASSEPPDPQAVKAALERHGLDPEVLNANVLQAQIRKMRTQLQINCEPVRGIMTALLETAITYRESILFELTNHAKDKSAVAKAQSRFAVPPQAPGSKIPAEAVSTLRNQAHYFNEVDKLVRLALKEKVLQTVKVPPGADLALLVMASGVRKSDFFFITAKQADDTNKKATIQLLAKDFSKLRQSWAIERDAYQKAFTRQVFEDLNGKYENAPDNWRELRDAYDASAKELKRVSESNRFEHCIGQIREELLQSAVGKNAPFFNPGPQGSVDALPGMGFNLAFEPTLSPFNFVVIPRQFPYRMDFKKSFRDARNLAILEIVGALEAKREATEAAAFIFSGNFNQAFGQAVFGLGENFKNFAVALVDGTAIQGINQLGGKLITDLRGVGDAVVDSAVTGFEARMEAFAKLVSDVDFSLSTSRQPGESDQQYIDRLTKVLDLEAQSDLLIDTASDVLIAAGEALTGNIAGTGLKAALKGGSKLIDDFVLADTGKRTRRAIADTRKDVANIDVADLRQRLEVDGKLDRAGKRFVDGVIKEQAAIKRSLDDVGRASTQLESKKRILVNQFGKLDGKPVKFDDPKPVAGGRELVDANGNPTGQQVPVGPKIASGASSSVNFDPTDPSSVIRTSELTKPNDPAVLKDEFGRKQLETLNLKTGRIVERKTASAAQTGGVDEFGFPKETKPSFIEKVERVNETASQIVKRQGGLTQGQEAARKAFLDELNKNELFFADNNGGNYTFENAGGDNWRVVVIDPGGILPAPSADIARQVQNTVDNFVDGGSFKFEDLPETTKILLSEKPPEVLNDPKKLAALLREDSKIADLTIQGFIKDKVDAARLTREMAEINNGLPKSLQVTDPSVLSQDNLTELITFGSVTAKRNTPGSLGKPIDLQSKLDDVAADAEKISDSANAAAARTDQLQRQIDSKLKNPNGDQLGSPTGAALVSLIDGGEDLGKRLQLAATGKFDEALKSDGENDQLDPEANKKLKDLGRALLTDFAQVECANLVEKVVTTAKNDNDPKAGLEDVDQEKVDACAGVGAKKGG